MQSVNSRHLLYFVALSAYVVVAFLPLFLLENDQVLPLIQENGLYQTYTAIAFFLASIFLFLAFFLPDNGNGLGKYSTRRNVFALLLALVLFVGAGEELSWGQHMLGFEPPEAIAKHNIQGEFNIHNLIAFAGRAEDGSPKTGLRSWLTVGRMFSLFWLGFCVLIPLTNLLSSRANQWMQKMNFPIVPLWIGLVFPINHVMSKIVAANTDIKGHYVVEVKESGFAFMFLLFAVTYYFHVRRKSRDAL